MKYVFIALVFTAIGVGITSLLKPWLARKPERHDEEYDEYADAKQASLEKVLGPMHDFVGHAIVPFQIGGGVDMYYFPKGIKGTGFATMELIEPDGTGPMPNQLGTYELVGFTKLSMPPMNEAEEVAEDHPYNKIERRMCGIFTGAGHYSYEAVLNPGETCELPQGEGEPNLCLIFDEYAPDGAVFEIDEMRYGLLLCLEVFRSEMKYAMKNGSATVLKKLKDAGHYPYSDMDRAPVC